MDKGPLLVLNRVSRLEIQSVMLDFRPLLCTVALLDLPKVTMYSKYRQCAAVGGGGGV
jgi:hypothetical protein